MWGKQKKQIVIKQSEMSDSSEHIKMSVDVFYEYLSLDCSTLKFGTGSYGESKRGK